MTLCNKLLCMDGVEGMKLLPDESIPMVVTSPPWDDIQVYGGHRFDFKAMADELWRVTMKGGVVCWNVGDQITDYTESCTSARQQLYFRGLGFKVNTLVTEIVKPCPRTRYRYGGRVQFVFVLSKGIPRTFDPIKDVENKYVGEIRSFTWRPSDGRTDLRLHETTEKYRLRGSVWRYPGGTHVSQDKEVRVHPAKMHEELARDLIRSWSRTGDVVLDPMSGVGTTAKMALLSNRRYIGFEIHRDYHDLAVKRLQNAAKRCLAAA